MELKVYGCRDGVSNKNSRPSFSKNYITKRILEANRQDLLIKSRREKNRYAKRLNYQVQDFRGVKLDKFFNEDYFVYESPINDYTVTLAFSGPLTELRKVVKATKGDVNRINYQLVLRALRIAFDKANDVKVRCTCDDFKYRFMYWAARNRYLYGPMTPGTEKLPKQTNPNDSLGAVCKHLDLFLSNKRWLIKAASIVTSLIKAYPEKAALYLYDEDDLIDTETEEPEVNDEPIEDTETSTNDVELSEPIEEPIDSIED